MNDKPKAPKLPTNRPEPSAKREEPSAAKQGPSATRTEPSAPKQELRKIRSGAIGRRWDLTRASLRYTGRELSNTLRERLSSGQSDTAESQRAENIQAFVEELGKLKGSIVKVGQIMATYGEYMLPGEVVDALHTLEDKTPAMHWPAIAKQLEKELGEAKLAELEVEQTPIAAASLAQVHRAMHKASGRELCLKIQYPGVAKTIDADFNLLIRMLKMARIIETSHTMEDWLSDVRALLHQEVDYLYEKYQLQTTAQRLAQSPRAEDYIVPEVVDAYCSERVICMSYEPGESLGSAEVAALSQAQRNRLGSALLQLFFYELYDWGEMQTDPNFGNYRVQIHEDGSAQLVLLDFGAVRDIPKGFLADFAPMIEAAYHRDKPEFIDKAIALGFMREHFPAKVLDDFAELGMYLVEPLREDLSEAPPEALNAEGNYCWQGSRLPKRVGKMALKASLSKYFALPPKEFMYIIRKLMGVYTLIAAADAQFNAQPLYRPYLDKPNT